MSNAEHETATQPKLVTVFGGSGFLGRYIVPALTRKGFAVRVAVRNPDKAGHLDGLSAPGMVSVAKADLADPQSVSRAVDGAFAVINLVGILFESGQQTFQKLQAEGPAIIAEAATGAGVERMVQVSAIGADPASPAMYGQTKAAGEAAVLARIPDAVIMRPSIVFGPEDDFFNRFSQMASFSPFIPVVGPDTRFQPVYVGDLAAAVVLAVEGHAKPGAIYELGGPVIDTFEGLMKRMLRITGKKRLVLALPLPIAKLQARLFELLPKPLLTRDQIKMLGKDNVVSETALQQAYTLEGLGITATKLDAILPTYL